MITAYDKSKPRRSKRYRGTFNYHDPKDLLIIEELRERVKELPGRYVKLQGRLGVNRSEAITEKYRRKSGNWSSNFCVELKDSAYVDAYVYMR